MPNPVAVDLGVNHRQKAHDPGRGNQTERAILSNHSGRSGYGRRLCEPPAPGPLRLVPSVPSGRSLCVSVLIVRADRTVFVSLSPGPSDSKPSWTRWTAVGPGPGLPENCTVSPPSVSSTPPQIPGLGLFDPCGASSISDQTVVCGMSKLLFSTRMTTPKSGGVSRWLRPTTAGSLTRQEVERHYPARACAGSR